MFGRSSSDLIVQYSHSHQHPVNRFCHTVGIPLIVLSIAVAVVAIFVKGLWWIAGSLFVVGWVFQFVGHAHHRIQLRLGVAHDQRERRIADDHARNRGHDVADALRRSSVGSIRIRGRRRSGENSSQEESAGESSSDTPASVGLRVRTLTTVPGPIALTAEAVSRSM